MCVAGFDCSKQESNIPLDKDVLQINAGEQANSLMQFIYL